MADERRDSDRELVEKCLSGEPGGWDEFVERHGPFLEREAAFAMRRFGAGGDAALAQDALQEIYRALLENDRAVLRGYRGDGPLERYLAVVAVTRVANFLRARRNASALDPASLDARWLEAMAARELRDAPDPLDREETRERLRAAFDRLSPRERVVLRFHYWDEVPLERIGRAFGMKTGAVKMLLSRARRQLKDILNSAICF